MNGHLLASGPCRFLPITLLALVSSGCRPELPTSESRPFATVDPPELVVSIEPDAPLTAAPTVLRARMQWTLPIDERRVFLVHGEVTDYHLRQIERDDISKTLMERMVPAVVWAEDERTVVVAPTVVLEVGQTYALASGEPSKVVHFVVGGEGNELPLLRRIWPPVDVPGTARLGIFCGPAKLPNLSMDIALDPFGPVGRLSRYIAPQGPGSDCVRFEVEQRWDALDAGRMVLPPVVAFPGIGGAVVQLEPSVFEESVIPTETVLLLECNREEVQFAFGCAQVFDDRLIVRAPEGELLWGIKGAGMDFVTRTRSKERFVLKGLPVESDIELDVVVMDPFGRTLRESFVATTMALSAHVVLNEVLANPVGPEPHQEWVELYNDGQVEAMLGGYRILDIGGDTVLPDVVLPPGEFAVVVNEKFTEDVEVDVVPAPGTIVVRVPSLGKSGLSNSGELLRLVDPDGLTISRFPALPKPKAGQSVSRRTPSAPDGVSDSYMISAPTPGLPNEVMGAP